MNTQSVCRDPMTTELETIRIANIMRSNLRRLFIVDDSYLADMNRAVQLRNFLNESKQEIQS